jgi:hypothetical protein
MRGSWRKQQALFLITLCLCCCSCAKREKIGAQHEAEAVKLNDRTIVYRVFSTANNRRLLVTEAFIENGYVQTLLPTPTSVVRGFVESPEPAYLASVPLDQTGPGSGHLDLYLSRSGALVCQGVPLEWWKVQHLLKYSPTSVVVAEIELPVRFEYFHDLLTVVAQQDRVEALVLLPVVNNPNPEPYLPVSAFELIGGSSSEE